VLSSVACSLITGDYSTAAGRKSFAVHRRRPPGFCFTVVGIWYSPSDDLSAGLAILRVAKVKVQTQMRRKVRLITLGKLIVGDSPASHDLRRKDPPFPFPALFRPWLRPKSETAERKSRRCFRRALGWLSRLCDVRRLSFSFHGLNVLLDGSTDAFVWCGSLAECCCCVTQTD
jgi:hypothetical protein